MNRSMINLLLTPAAAVISCFAVMLAAVPANAAYYTHIYELNGSFADSEGGPSMVSGGGTLGGSGYSFTSSATERGPSLSDAMDPAAYSLEMKFSIDTSRTFNRLLDFKIIPSDFGVYYYSSFDSIFLSSYAISGSLGFPNDTPVNLIVTRDGSNNFKAYFNGVLALNLADTGGYANPDSPNNIIHFLKDDSLGEDPAHGFIDYVRIYSGVLTQTQVTGLAGGATPQELGMVPEPASLALVGAGALACLRKRRA